MTNTNLPKRFTKKPVTIEATYSPESAALAQSGQGEAVAWMWEQATYGEGDVRGRQWVPSIGRLKPSMPWMVQNLVPLFTRPQPAQPSHAVAAIRARLAQEEVRVPKRSDKQDDDFASGLRSGLRIALEMLEAEAQPARVVGTVTGYQTASGAQQWQFNPSNVAGLENQRFDVALSTPTAAPTTSQAAVTELETQLADALEKAISGMRLLLKVQSDTAAEYAVSDSLIQALAAYAKKAGA